MNKINIGIVMTLLGLCSFTEGVKGYRKHKCVSTIIFLDYFDDYYTVYLNNAILARHNFTTDRSTGAAVEDAICVDKILAVNSLIIRNRKGEAVLSKTIKKLDFKRFVYVRKYKQVWSIEYRATYYELE